MTSPQRQAVICNSKLNKSLSSLSCVLSVKKRRARFWGEVVIGELSKERPFSFLQGRWSPAEKEDEDLKGCSRHCEHHRNEGLGPVPAMLLRGSRLGELGPDKHH